MTLLMEDIERMIKYNRDPTLVNYFIAKKMYYTRLQFLLPFIKGFKKTKKTPTQIEAFRQHCLAKRLANLQNKKD